MGRARPSMQELIARRRRAGFVGRSHERVVFRRNLESPPEDEHHRFLFHVHGNAGVGKTFLVREFEQIARERGALTAYVDESVDSVPEAMGTISRQLGLQGRRLKELDRLLAVHRERRREAEAIAVVDAEPGDPSAAGLVVARAGLVGLGMLPGVGAFAGALDAGQLAQGADRFRASLSARFRSQEDVQLVLTPERVLTPVLLGELSEAASTAPWIVLFFDTYERTGPFLDGWLHEVITTDRYGTLSADVVIVTDPRPTALRHRSLGRLRGLHDGRAARAVHGGGGAGSARLQGGGGRAGCRRGAAPHGRPAGAGVDPRGDPARRSGRRGRPSTTAVERFLKWSLHLVRCARSLWRVRCRGAWTRTCSGRWWTVRTPNSTPFTAGCGTTVRRRTR